MIVKPAAPAPDATMSVGSGIYREEWLPVLGPTSYLLMLDLKLHCPGRVELYDVSRRLGVKPQRARDALDRLVHFGQLVELIETDDGEQLYGVVLASRPPGRPPNRKFDRSP